MRAHSSDFLRTRKFIFAYRKKYFRARQKQFARAPLQNSVRKEENLRAEENLFSFGRKIIFVRKENNLRAHANMSESRRIVNRLITANYKIRKNDEKLTLPFPQNSMEKGKVSS